MAAAELSAPISLTAFFIVCQKASRWIISAWSQHITASSGAIKLFLNQLTANAAWHKDNFHVGLNLHNQIYHLGDVTFLRSFERIISDKYVLRPQLGLLYSGRILECH